MNSLRLIGITAIALSAINVAVANDEDVHPLMTSGVSIDAGAFLPVRELDLSVNGTFGENEKIDFDRGLKLRNADSVFSGELAWRFRSRWSFLAQYFKSSDSASVTLEEDIEWGDIVFGAGTTVSAGTSFTLTKFFVGRHWDLSGNRHDIGVGGGIHWLSLNSFIEGTIIENGTPIEIRQTARTEGPLPNLGFWYRYSISPRWAFRSRFDVLKANVGRYNGLLLTAALGVNFQAFEHVGLGVSYNYFELDVKVDQSDWRGKVETIYDGAYVYVSAFFD